MNINKNINRLLDTALGIKITRSHRHEHTKAADKVPSKNLSTSTIREFVGDMNKVFLEGLREPTFVDTDSSTPKRLNVPINSSIRAIKIKLPTTNCLHLHSLIIFDEKNQPINTSDLRILTSSRHDYHDQLTEKEHRNRLFNPNGDHSYAFHTKNARDSWLMVAFPDQVYVSSISINNRVTCSDPREYMAPRALGLQVFSTNSFKKWKLNYDLGGVENFNKEAAVLADRYAINDYEGGKVLFEFTKAILQGNDKATKTAHRQLPQQHYPIIKSAVNDLILTAKNLECTSHGVRRSFRFWSLDEKKAYLKATAKLVEDLQSLSPDVCLGFGSVLAAVRDKDFLPHDDDTDIIIAFSRSDATTFKETLTILEDFLTAQGYVCVFKNVNLYQVISNGFKVDIFAGIYDEDKTIGWYPGNRGILKRSDVFPAKKATMLDIDVKVPKKHDTYLESIYGEGWSSPDPLFKHTWSDLSQYEDLIAKR